MRLNVDGRPGLVIMSKGKGGPSFFMPMSVTTYHVTGTGDSAVACANPANCPSLRGAIVASNANAGADTIVFDINGTFTLTIPLGVDLSTNSGATHWS
jgi:hypothetical protein